MARKPIYHECPVCDRRHKDGAPCSPAVLKGIDAADSAAWNAELDPDKQALTSQPRPYYERLAQGFRWLDDDMD